VVRFGQDVLPAGAADIRQNLAVLEEYGQRGIVAGDIFAVDAFLDKWPEVVRTAVHQHLPNRHVVDQDAAVARPRRTRDLLGQTIIEPVEQGG